eukprot:1147622-Pelagomonas_calceolata.AAC.9
MYANKLVTTRRAIENKDTSCGQVMEPALWWWGLTALLSQCVSSSLIDVGRIQLVGEDGLRTDLVDTHKVKLALKLPVPSVQCAHKLGSTRRTLEKTVLNSCQQDKAQGTARNPRSHLIPIDPFCCLLLILRAVSSDIKSQQTCPVTGLSVATELALQGDISAYCTYLTFVSWSQTADQREASSSTQDCTGNKSSMGP